MKWLGWGEDKERGWSRTWGKGWGRGGVKGGEGQAGGAGEEEGGKPRARRETFLQDTCCYPFRLWKSALPAFISYKVGELDK